MYVNRGGGVIVSDKELRDGPMISRRNSAWVSATKTPPNT